MHYYGHGSWIALVLLGGVLLIRLLSSPRRRSGQPGPGSTSQFTSSAPGPPTGPRVTPDAPPASGGGVAPGWFTDPTGRHAQRYWSGAEWTEHILDDGVPGNDPPPGPPTTGMSA